MRNYNDLYQPTRALAIQKDIINRTQGHRSCSTPRTRNPITQGDPAPVVRPPKSLVPNYLTEQKKLTERPQGIAKSVFSYQLFDSFNIGYDPPMEHKPSIRISAQPHQPNQRQTVSRKLIVRPETPQRNPILMTNFEQPPVIVQKKRGYPERTGRVEVEDKEEVIQESKQISQQGLFSKKRNSSQIFSCDENLDIFGTRKRALPGKPAVTDSILQYRYALPYREDKITRKLVQN